MKTIIHDQSATNMNNTILSFSLSCCLLVIGATGFSQTPVEVSHGCTIIERSKAGEHESAFCSDCDFWPNGVIPYEFHSNVDNTQRQKMLDAMARLEGIANIDFIPRNGHDNYIRVVADNSNTSAVGMQGGGQDVTIVSWNSPMVICHELLHALGFWHEQSRPDRNNYVKVNTSNICPGQSHNFDIENTGVTSNIPYDFSSIMHYGSFAFSICSDPGFDCNTGCGGGLFFAGPTIEVLPQHQNAQNQIGNRNYISRTDSLMLRFVYPFQNDRFVNNQSPFVIPPPFIGGSTIYWALASFTTNLMMSSLISTGSTVWIMPGTFENTEGTYSKPMTLTAPFGGVVLR